jgi:phosphoglucosamine mutase
MARLFGTDGVRGRAGVDLTADLAERLGRAAVRVLGRHGDGHPTFVVGRDPRESGVWLEASLLRGITDGGGDAIAVGVEPTPAIAFLTSELPVSSGVVISASHNPAHDNGIKFFGPNGMKIADDLEDEIEAQMSAPDEARAAPGRIRTMEGARERYLHHLERAADAKLDGLTVVVDAANGAASEVAPELYRRLGATVQAIYAEPDGENINDGCGALHPEVVADAVVRAGADVGISHDGDADRALFADASGRVIDGDQVLAACAIAMHERGTLTNGIVVTTVMANLGFLRAMREHAIEVRTTKVGDRYVLEEMLTSGAVLGGEQSGHVIFLDHATTGDGLLTAVRFLSLAAERDRSVAELASAMQRFPQVMVNVPVRDRDALDGDDRVQEGVRRAEEDLGEDGRVLVRASGTEPVVRVMVEAASIDAAQAQADAIAAVVAASLG